MVGRAMYFGPGPAALPLPALERAARDVIDFEGTGLSILEHSHRGRDYAAVHQEAKDLVRRVLGVPDHYEVLFMQGGARGQFALVPMNLAAGQSADYVVTGIWAQKALEEAQVVGRARAAFDSRGSDGLYRFVPKPEQLSLDPEAAFVHITSNNTVYGTQFPTFPKTDAPLVADMSSDIASRVIDVSQFGLIYAGAQKNLGPAGITLVIVRKDLIERSPSSVPSIFRYSVIAASDSLQNTIPTFSVYMVRNVLAWIEGQGGIPVMQSRNEQKAALVYEVLDAHPEFFSTPVEPASRSKINVVFQLRSPELEAQFLAECTAQRMLGLKGHRVLGGVRVSLYNAVDISCVERLAEFMDQFARKHG